MAIAHDANCVIGNDKTAGTTLLATAAIDVTVGQVVVLVVSCDNTATSDATDGSSNEVLSVADESGNVWTKIAECREGSAGAAAGQVVAVFICKVTVQIDSGDDITVTFANSVAASAMNGHCFDVGAGNTLQSAGTIQYAATEAADLPSMAHSGLANKEYLFFRACGLEREQVDVDGQFVATTDFTALAAAAGTTGGGSATNSYARGEFRILTGTGATSDPTTAPGTGDHAHLFIAFEEVAAASGTGAGVNRGLVTARHVGINGGLIRSSMTKLGNLWVPKRPRLVPVGIALTGA